MGVSLAEVAQRPESVEYRREPGEFLVREGDPPLRFDVPRAP